MLTHIYFTVIGTMVSTWLCYKRLGCLFCAPKRASLLLLEGFELNGIRSCNQATTKFGAPTTWLGRWTSHASVFFPCGGTESRGTSVQASGRAYCTSPGFEMSGWGGERERGRVWSTGGTKIGKERRITRRQPCPMSLCPPKILLSLSWDWTRSSAMRSLWLTSLAMLQIKWL